MKSIYPILLVVFFIFAGWLVQYIPSEPTDSNIKKACSVLKSKSTNSRMNDNYTDAIMLMLSKSEILEPSFERFMYSPIHVVHIGKKKGNYSPLLGLCNESFLKAEKSYARYWHGYQIILRPLLYFTTYQNMRLFNKILQPILFLLIATLFYKRKMYSLIPAWVVCYIVLSPIAIAISITFAIIYYILSFSLLLMLTIDKKIEENVGWPVFFMIIGICVAYFDILTYPIVSLAVPLTVLFYMYPPENFINMIKKMITVVFSWGAGYVGMWSFKWILATIFTKENIIKDALEQILFRALSTSGRKTIYFYDGLNTTFKTLIEDDATSVILCLVIVISLIAILVNYRKCFEILMKNYYQFLPFLIISQSTIIWCLIVNGHSTQHYMYVYRIWVAFFFPIISGMNFLALKAYKNK